jgi:hypothetical protein
MGMWRSAGFVNSSSLPTSIAVQLLFPSSPLSTMERSNDSVFFFQQGEMKQIKKIHQQRTTKKKEKRKETSSRILFVFSKSLGAVIHNKKKGVLRMLFF